MAPNTFTRKYSLDKPATDYIPPGGNTGDVLAKRSDADRDVEWNTPESLEALTSSELDAIIALIS